jgi:hypothetical protein
MGMKNVQYLSHPTIVHRYELKHVAHVPDDRVASWQSASSSQKHG